MSKKAKQLLVKWIVHVFYMIGHNYVSYSLKEREELAQLTADLEEELEK